MPLQLNGELGWGNGLNNTTFWVPDHQLGDYIKMFNTIGDAVPNVYSFTDYNITFPRFAHWYEYPGIELYDDKDNYMYANGNDN